MAETNLRDTIYQYCLNPKLRKLFLTLYETSTGHNHDGSNSRAVSVGTVGDGLITNAKLATDVKVGSLADLNTSATSSLVAALNEINGLVNDLEGSLGTLSSLTTTEKSNLVSSINEVVASITGFASLDGAETLTNKKLTEPLIDDTGDGVTVTSEDQTNAAATVTIPDIGDAADEFVMKDTSQTLTLKTLTTPVVASMYQDAGKTKLMTVPNVSSDTFVVLAAAQTLTNKTLTTPVVASIYQDAGKTKLMTLPDAASDTFVVIAAAQTLTNKTLTSPVINSPDLTLGVSSVHNYSSGHADWELSAGELATTIVSCSNADQAVNAIATPTAGKVYIVTNGSGYALTFKASGQTGVEIANAKTAIVMGNGTDFIRVTGDA